MAKKFTELFPEDLTFETKSRIQKAKKIQAVLNAYLGNTKTLTCLDLGCSVGIITKFLSKYYNKVVGIDVDNFAIVRAKKNNNKKNVGFMVSKENRIPSKNNSFDVVVFNQIYEHVKDPKIVINEIKRVLKKDGVCFFGARNKFGIFDGHYSLPFISWIPKDIANLYVKKTTNKKEYDINLYSYWQLKKLVENFKVIDFTLKVINNPYKFNAKDAVPSKYGINKVILLISKILYVFIPNYIWVLKKI